MDRHKPRTGRLAALAGVITIIAAACGGSTASPSAASTAAASQAPAVTPIPVAVTPAPVATGEGGLTADGKVLIRWFVGLGTGAQPDQIADEQQVVTDFNASQDKIVLSLEIYQNTTAYDILSTQIAAGNPPDIIGPVGFRGFYSYGDQLLDLQPYIEKTKYDLSDMDPGILEAYNKGFGGQVGIPFAIYPSFIYYNKDLFKEAGLAEPPHKVGEQYDGKDWTWDTLTELAKQLTVDSKGNDATNAAFDNTDIAQWGYYQQWTDPRGWGTQRGAGSLVADDGKTAQIPPNWLDAWKWYYDGMWKDHFIPTGSEDTSELLNSDNAFQSGNLAMANVHLWYTCCAWPADGDPQVKNFDIAVPPSDSGTTTAKLHSDTFGIMKQTAHPDEAFEVLTYLLGNDTLIARYGALPAVKSKQAAFFDALDERFAPNKIDWQVALDMLAYPDVPSHEADLPNFLKSDAAVKAFQAKLIGSDGLDVAAEAEKFQTELQGLYDSAP